MRNFENFINEGLNLRKKFIDALKHNKPDKINTMFNCPWNMKVNKYPAINYAILNQSYDALKKALEKGSKPNNINAEKIEESPLHLISSEKNHWFKNDKTEKIIKILLKHGANIEQEVDGNTPLHVAAGHENIIAIETLLKHGADPLIENDRGDIFFEILKNPYTWSTSRKERSINWFNKNKDIQRFIMKKWGEDFSHFKDYIDPKIVKEFPEFSEGNKLGLL